MIATTPSPASFSTAAMALAGADSSSAVTILMVCLPLVLLNTSTATEMPSCMPAPTRASEPVSGISAPTRISSAKAPPTCSDRAAATRPILLLILFIVSILQSYHGFRTGTSFSDASGLRPARSLPHLPPVACGDGTISCACCLSRPFNTLPVAAAGIACITTICDGHL